VLVILYFDLLRVLDLIRITIFILLVVSATFRINHTSQTRSFAFALVIFIVLLLGVLLLST
jgi:hypothetical protein